MNVIMDQSHCKTKKTLYFQDILNKNQTQTDQMQPLDEKPIIIFFSLISNFLSQGMPYLLLL